MDAPFHLLPCLALVHELLIQLCRKYTFWFLGVRQVASDPRVCQSWVIHFSGSFRNLASRLHFPRLKLLKMKDDIIELNWHFLLDLDFKRIYSHIKKY